jgi:hypothetical protein
MQQCDVCKKSTTHLTVLRDIYKSDGTSEVCEDCRKVLGKELSRIQSATVQIQIGWFKNLIRQLQGAKNV